jgi:hypothetical protein
MMRATNIKALARVRFSAAKIVSCNNKKYFHDNEFMRGEFGLTVDSFECQTLCNQEYNENEVYDSFIHHASLYCD